MGRTGAHRIRPVRASAGCPLACGAPLTQHAGDDLRRAMRDSDPGTTRGDCTMISSSVDQSRIAAPPFARNRRAGRLLGLAAGVLVILATGASAAVVVDEDGEPILPKPRPNGASYSRGDIHFACDPTWVYRPGSGMHVEVRLRLPNDELRFLPTDKGYAGSIQLSVSASPPGGSRIRQNENVSLLVADEPTALSRDHVQLLSSQFDATPGTYDLLVTILDRNANKRGVLNALRKKHKIGRAEVRVVVPEPPARETLTSSPLQFCWGASEDQEGNGTLSHGRLTPNPARLYGLYQSTVQAYFETYDQIDTTGTLYYVDHRIVNTQGDTMLAAVDTVDARGSAFGHVVSSDLAGLVAGRYICVVSVHRADGRSAPATTGEFDLVWQGDSWSATDEEQLDLTRFLVDEDTFLQFESLTPGQREVFLTEFWRAKDPTPDTAFNEMKAEFERRVQFVETHYAALGRGINSDRGKLYVRLGPPDDVNTHAMPINRETVQNELENTTSGADLLNSAVPRFDEIDRNRPFEVWTYDRGGHPLFADNTANLHQIALTFVFIDQRGWGDYTLKYTTEGVKH